MSQLDTALLEKLVSGVADVAFLIDDNGQILNILAEPKETGGALSNWVSENVRSILTVESVAKFESRIEQFRDEGTARPFELNHSATVGSWSAPVLYSLHDIGSDGMTLMMGRDLAVVSELQNQLVEAQLVLERDHERQRDFETRFRVLMATVDHCIVLASVDTGRILDCNGPAASLLGKGREELIEGSLANEFLGRRSEELIEALTTAARSDTAREMQLNVRRTGADVIATPILFRAAGDRLVLLRLEADATPKPGRGDVSQLMTSLFQRGTDAVVFTGRDGMIQQTNEAFLSFVDVAYDTEVRDKPLADFLVRGAVDFRVWQTMLRRPAPCETSPPGCARFMTPKFRWRFRPPGLGIRATRPLPLSSGRPPAATCRRSIRPMRNPRKNWWAPQH